MRIERKKLEKLRLGEIISEIVKIEIREDFLRGGSKYEDFSPEIEEGSIYKKEIYDYLETHYPKKE